MVSRTPGSQRRSSMSCMLRHANYEPMKDSCKYTKWRKGGLENREDGCICQACSLARPEICSICMRCSYLHRDVIYSI